MKLYNTLTRKVEEIAPLDGKTVRIYSCGPTVYDHAHIGNLSAYLFADTLHRALAAIGYNVQHVMNYTDVDDKTIRRSREKYPEKNPRDALHELTTHYINVFLGEMQKIGNNTSEVTFMRATDNIEAMQALIARLRAGGFAYIADDGVYFSIEAYRKSGKTYGQLLEISASNTSEARIQNDEYDKESVHDFALWKKQKEGEPAWEFTLDGHDMKGRPGWHIECSAMSRAALGQPFDIHTGGVDLIFPHHENEIAQSTAGEKNPVMAQVFAHNEHILVDGKKMAKSAQNFFTLQDVTAKGFDPIAFRLMILQAHYRSQVNFTWESLEAAQNRLKNWQQTAVLRWQTYRHDETQQTTAAKNIDKYLGAAKDDLAPLFDDLDTPSLFANVDRRFSTFDNALVSESDKQGFDRYLQMLDEALGLELLKVADISDEQKQAIARREQARADKDWAKSDELRGQLAERGIGVRDTAHGSIWFRL